MRFDDIDEGVAGPEKCWPGYRKVGTKPGTGKNAGKRVNDCEKIKEGISDEVDSADVGEYDREGEMAQSQLQTAEDAASELRSILDADENLPEWVQSKITKAVDYLDTARDYMKSEKQGVAEGINNDFEQAHHSEVEKYITTHGTPGEYRHKYDAMGNAHNSYLTYPGRTVTINTQQYGDRFGHNVFTKKEGVAEGFSDVVKGVKRKVAGKEDPKEVEHMYGRIARSAIKHKTPDQAEKDIERYKKVSKVVNKEGVAEEQLEETTPDAIAKINELTRRP